MGGWVVFWPWAECVVALFIQISAIITKAKLTRIGAIELGCTLFISCNLWKGTGSDAYVVSFSCNRISLLRRSPVGNSNRVAIGPGIWGR